MFRHHCACHMDMLEKRDLDDCLFIATSKPKIQNNNLKFPRILTFDDYVVCYKNEGSLED